MTNPLSFYESVVRSLGCAVKEDGSLIYELDDKPITVGDKPLALPLDTIIREKGFQERFQVFHPLCESDIRNPGPVLLMTRTLARKRLRDVFAILMLELMKLAADKTRHASLSPEQAQFLTLLPDVNEKTVSDMEAVVDAIGKGGAQLIDLHLRKGGVLKGETFKRSCIVSFPMLAPPDEDNPNDKGNTLGGVTLSSKKSRKAILALVGYILPQLADGTADGFSAGSRSDYAPYFQSLMFSFCRVMTELNKKVWKFRKHIPLHEMLHADLKWEDTLGELSDFNNAIPVIAGNDGEEPQVEEPEGAVGVAKPAAVATPRQSASRLPDRQNESEARDDKRGISTLYRGNRPKEDPETLELQKFEEAANNTLDHGYGARRTSVDRSGYYRSGGGRPALNAVGEPPPPPEPNESRNSLRDDGGRQRYYRDDRFRGQQETRSAPRLARGDF